jgi:hypothetical protein
MNATPPSNRVKVTVAIALAKYTTATGRALKPTASGDNVGDLGFIAAV